MIYTIPGEPRGKQRPRYTLRGGYAHEYTPTETVAYEKKVRAFYFEAGGKMLDGPLRIEVWAFMKIPESKSERQKALMEGAPCIKKPDIDNVVKIVMDGLNGAAYSDDKQVVEVTAHKRYLHEPKIVVSIQEI